MTRRVLPEYEKTEKPLIEQLTGLGWEHLEGAPPGTPATDPGASGRTSFTEVVYAERFRTAVRRINPGPDGTPWLKRSSWITCTHSYAARHLVRALPNAVWPATSP